MNGERQSRPRPSAGAQPRAGQAMIELLIGMIMIIMLVAGGIQFINVATMHREIDSRIRGDMGALAMSSVTAYDTPSAIQNWNVGPDGQPYTADDTSTSGSSATFSTIVGYSTSVSSYWDELNNLSHSSSLAALHSTASLNALGFVGAGISQNVPVSDIVQQMIYKSPNVLVKETVWMPVTTGLY